MHRQCSSSIASAERLYSQHDAEPCFLCLTAQYVVIGRHRLSWVNFGEIMQSKADLMHFCMELAKKLDIWYRNPPLPVDLNIVGRNWSDAMGRLSLDGQPLTKARADSLNDEPLLDLGDLQSQFRPKFDWQR